MKSPRHWALVVLLAAGSAGAQQLQSVSPMEQFQADKAALERNPNLTHIPNSILVKFRAGTPAENGSAALAASNSRAVRSFNIVPGLTHVRTSMPMEQALAALRDNPWVEYAEPDFVQRTIATNTNDTYVGLQWGLDNTGQDIRGIAGVADADIDMPEAWDIITGDANKVVAVIDSGTQWTHPDLDTNIWFNAGEVAGNGIDDDGNGFIDDVRGWDFFDNDNNPDDTEGHGTHVAGTIGAEGNNNQGVVGVMWDVQIMPLRFLGPFGGSTSDAVAAVDYAVANGATVSNNSWGGGGFSLSLYNAIANARNNGHIFVAAAGNSGVNTDGSPHYPSSYDLDNIISVAATDNRDRLAGFSNYGVSSVDIGAPGVDIASTYNGSGYVWSSGTSMASPHVAGLVALLQVQNPSWTYDQVIDRIYATARPNPNLAGLTLTGGVMNAFDALSGGTPPPPANTQPDVVIASPFDGATFTEGDSLSFSGSASDAEDGNLSSFITWTSSLDGAIGAGASFQTSSLSVGTHTITARVIDSGSLSATDTVSISVAAAPPPAGEPPAAPSGVNAANQGNRTALVTWSDNSDNESVFEIQREKQNRRGAWGGTTTFSVSADTTSLSDRAGTGDFRYRVRAVNDSGASAWSAWAEARVTR
ncbi:MAG: S8 family serine peptidase [Phycisphaerales bacterium JB037]